MKLSTVFGLVGIILIVIFILCHEYIHQVIFTMDGIKSKIGFYDYTIATKPESNCKTSECKLAHEINEIVGYPLMLIFLLLWFGLFIIIFILEENDKTNK